MGRFPIWSRYLLIALVTIGFVSTAAVQHAYAQADGTDGTTDGTTDGGTDDGTVVVGPLPGAGVVVNAAGVLSIQREVDRSGRLDRDLRLVVTVTVDGIDGVQVVRQR